VRRRTLSQTRRLKFATVLVNEILCPIVPLRDEEKRVFSCIRVRAVPHDCAPMSTRVLIGHGAQSCRNCLQQACVQQACVPRDVRACTMHASSRPCRHVPLAPFHAPQFVTNGPRPAPAHRVSRPRGTGSVGNSVGQGAVVSQSHYP